MSGTPSRSPDSRRRGVIVLAGEDSNDCKIVAQILRAHIGDVKMVEITDKVRLRSARSDATRAERVRTLIGKAKGRALRAKAELLGIVVHEDMDGPADAAYTEARNRITVELRRQSPCNCAFALAAFESEAWLLLFPQAFANVQSGWKLPASLIGRDSGLLADPKETLQRALSSPRFRESDGPIVAAAANKLGLMTSPHGRNRSYQDFVTELGTWSHTPS